MHKKRAESFWLNAMFYTMLQRVLLFVFGVAGYMILVRGFSTSTNGVWALYITLFSLFEAVKQGLLRNATIRFLGMNEYHLKKDAVQTSSLSINMLFSLFMILVIIVLGDWISIWLNSPNLFSLLLISGINILLLIPFNHCEILLQSKLKFDSLFNAAFIRQGSFFTGLLIVYFFYREYFTLVNVLIIQIFALLIALLYILNRSSSILSRIFVFETALTKQFFHFGKYTFGTNLFFGVSRSLDHFITASALGPVGKNYVAYYNTVTRINNMVDVPSLAAADVLYPKNVEALQNEGIEKVKYYFEQVIGTILAIIVPATLFIFLFPNFIINIIAGPEYKPAVAILQLTVLFSVVRPLSYQFGSTLDAIGKPDINFLSNTFFLMLNFFLTYIFLKTFGGIGAAYASMIHYTITCVVMMIILKKYINIHFGNILQFAIKRYKDIFSRFA